MAMTAQTQLETTKTVLTNLSYPKELGYYRSKVYTFYQQSNPLLSAAQPVFSCIERIKLYKAPPQLTLIQDSIRHELNAFRSKVSLSHYSQEYITIACYLLSATVDEILAKVYQSSQKEQVSFKAFTPIASDNIGPEQRFFDILELILETPNQYLDLIELAYLCLNSGFEGKYHFEVTGKQQLDDIIEKLFNVLEQYKSNKKHQFFNDHQVNVQTEKVATPWYLITIACISIVIISFIISQFTINNEAIDLINTHLSTQLVNHGS